MSPSKKTNQTHPVATVPAVPEALLALRQVEAPIYSTISSSESGVPKHGKNPPQKNAKRPDNSKAPESLIPPLIDHTVTDTSHIISSAVDHKDSPGKIAEGLTGLSMTLKHDSVRQTSSAGFQNQAVDRGQAVGSKEIPVRKKVRRRPKQQGKRKLSSGQSSPITDTKETISQAKSPQFPSVVSLSVDKGTVTKINEPTTTTLQESEKSAACSASSPTNHNAQDVKYSVRGQASQAPGARFQRSSRHKVPYSEFDCGFQIAPGNGGAQVRIGSNTVSEFARPTVPASRKIYDPNRHPGLPSPNRDITVAIREQCQYLDDVARYQVGNSEISFEELTEKEALRLDLQELCRWVVSQLAAQVIPYFNPRSVQLRCFGSLRTGFSTKSADMDLALVSPETEADPNFDDSSIPRLLENVLLVQGFGARLLTRTRVPIIKFCEKPSPELLSLLKQERIKWQEAHATASTQIAASSLSPTLTSQRPTGYQSSELADSARAEDTPSTKVQSPKDGKWRLSDHSDEYLIRLLGLAIQEGWFNTFERQAIAQFTKCFHEAKGNSEDGFLVKAREDLCFISDVLSKYREPPDNRLEFPKSGIGIQCDINFSNPLALHNTQLLRCYSLCDSRIRELILFVKAWAKKRDINTPYKGTLSSYGYVLMILHYAVNIANPALAPNLQLHPNAARGCSWTAEPRNCMGYNVQFWRDEKEIKAARRHGQIGYNKESVGSLLRGFFQYFAENGHPNFVPRGGFAWTREVLSLRTDGGILSKEEKGWTGARTDTIEATSAGEKPVEIRQRFLFAIEDPFEIEHNVARPVTHNGICAIRDEFRRANRIIKTAGTINDISVDLFTECKHTELDREVKYFGPNPANNIPKTKTSTQKEPLGLKLAGQKPAGSRLSGPRVYRAATKKDSSSPIATPDQERQSPVLPIEPKKTTLIRDHTLDSSTFFTKDDRSYV